MISTFKQSYSRLSWRLGALAVQKNEPSNTPEEASD